VVDLERSKTFVELVENVDDSTGIIDLKSVVFENLFNWLKLLIDDSVM